MEAWDENHILEVIHSRLPPLTAVPLLCSSLAFSDALPELVRVTDVAEPPGTLLAAWTTGCRVGAGSTAAVRSTLALTMPAWGFDVFY